MIIKGKIALVTGASRGVGQQIAIGLAKEGCNLILHARKISNLEKTLSLIGEYNVEVFTVEAELNDISQIKSMISVIEDNNKTVDILYNNAAIMTSWSDNVWDVDINDWEQSFKVNLYAMVTLINHFAPKMIANKYGRIINTTSGIEKQPQLAPYSASKAAVDKYTQDLIEKLKGTGVIINTLDPGWLKTDLGGEHADHEVETVRNGAIVPAKFDSDDKYQGLMVRAQEYNK